MEAYSYRPGILVLAFLKICFEANLDNQFMQNETKGGTPEKVMYEWFGHATLSSSSSDVGRNAGRCLKLVKLVWVDVSVFSVKGIYSKPTRKSKYINWNRSWIITHQLKRTLQKPEATAAKQRAVHLC